MNYLTCAANSTDSLSIKEMLELVRKFRCEHPPETMPVRAEMPRSMWKALRSLTTEVAHVPASLMQAIHGLPIYTNDNIPENCYSLEYADGHADMITPVGHFRWKDAR